jgi:hypothetical protein
MRPLAASALLVLLSTASGGCGASTSTSTSTAPGASSRPAKAAADDVVMATVDGAPIRRDDLLAEMRRTGKGARAELNQLIDDQLLVEAARRSLDAADPDVVEATDRAAVQLMLEREVEPTLDKSGIPDETLRSLYDKAHSAFVHPRLIEVALLSVYTGARMKDEPRARALETAKALEASVRARPSAAPGDFKAIADEPAWRDRHVKYARIWQALDEPFAADVGRPVAALARPGQTTSLIVAESGDHLARYISERPAENVTFEMAKPMLRDQIAERWRQARFLDFVQTAANPHRIEAFPERLAETP